MINAISAVGAKKNTTRQGNNEDFEPLEYLSKCILVDQKFLAFNRAATLGAAYITGHSGHGKSFIPAQFFTGYGCCFSYSGLCNDGEVTRKWFSVGSDEMLADGTIFAQKLTRYRDFEAIVDPIKQDLSFLYALMTKDGQDSLSAIDYLYQNIDVLQETYAFFRIDSIILFVVSKNFSIRLLIALLTITHAKRNSYSNRELLIEHTRKAATEQGLTPKQISAILKGF